LEVSILQHVQNLGTDGGADALVNFIFADGFVYPTGEPAYIEKYFNARVRTAVFSGGSYNGRYVKLSPAAARLKSAFQRRYVSQGDFAPHTAYHVTGGAHIAGMIAETGMKDATSAALGKGAYFWNTPTRAEDYIPGSPCVGEKIVIEVTIFSSIANREDQRKQINVGWQDVLTNQPSAAIYVVKNPLLIFPKAVFYPGEMKMRTEFGIDDGERAVL
jgi:hypothetical protein